MSPEVPCAQREMYLKEYHDAVRAYREAVVCLDGDLRWDAYGNCLSGPLAGTHLDALILEPEYWFAWSEFHPNTAIYSAPAHPGAR